MTFTSPRRTPCHRAPRGRARTAALLAESQSSLVTAAPQLGVRQVFARFWPLTKPFRLRLAVCLMFVAVGPAMDALGIWIFKILIDDVLTPHDFALFPLVAAAYIGIAVLGGLLSFVDDYLCTWVGERFVLTLRTTLFGHVHRIKVLIFGGLLFYLNWKLALASLVAAPLFALASRYFSTRIKAASREKRRRTGTISAVAEESLSNAALVQAYDRQASETARFHTENLGAFAAQMVATRLRATFGPFIDLLETGAVPWWSASGSGSSPRAR